MEWVSLVLLLGVLVWAIAKLARWDTSRTADRLTRSGRESRHAADEDGDWALWYALGYDRGRAAADDGQVGGREVEGGEVADGVDGWGHDGED